MFDISLPSGVEQDHPPLYHKYPSPYRTLPSPASAISKTQIQSPTSKRTRFAYFLFNSAVSACSGGTPKLEGWIAIVSCSVSARITRIIEYYMHLDYGENKHEYMDMSSVPRRRVKG
jgi:hypothetical protein